MLFLQADDEKESEQEDKPPDPISQEIMIQREEHHLSLNILNVCKGI